MNIAVISLTATVLGWASPVSPAMETGTEIESETETEPEAQTQLAPIPSDSLTPATRSGIMTLDNRLPPPSAADFPGR